MQVWNVLHAARWKLKKSPKSRHLGTIVQLCWAISSQLRHVSTIGKNMLSSNISSRCPHNMVNFGLLAAEIDQVVWGTPANFNGFRVLAALLHGSRVVSVSQTLRRWTEGATYVRQGDHHVGHWPTLLLVMNHKGYSYCNLHLVTAHTCHSVITHTRSPRADSDALTRRMLLMKTMNYCRPQVWLEPKH